MRLKHLALVALLMLIPLTGSAQEMTLQGQVERHAEVQGDMLHGQVIDAKTGQPLGGVQVTLPDTGFRMMTDQAGQYQVPRPRGQQPFIMGIEKPGYAPLSATIREDAPPRFTIALQQQARMQILDSQLRHLGDDGYSPRSASAMQFRTNAYGPSLQLQFDVPAGALGNAPYVQIGSIIGLDTAMAHFLSGNTINSSGPLIVRLNRQVIAQVQVNGDNQKIMLPRKLINLHGPNFLEIEAGTHYPEPGRMDYDDMELMHVVLYY